MEETNKTTEVKEETNESKKRKNRPSKLGNYRCSKCGTLGHNKAKCPHFPKEKRLTNKENEV